MINPYLDKRVIFGLTSDVYDSINSIIIALHQQMKLTVKATIFSSLNNLSHQKRFSIQGNYGVPIEPMEKWAESGQIWAGNIKFNVHITLPLIGTSFQIIWPQNRWSFFLADFPQFFRRKLADYIFNFGGIANYFFFRVEII